MNLVCGTGQIVLICLGMTITDCNQWGDTNKCKVIGKRMTTVDHLAASETRITPKKTKIEVHHLATKWKSFLLNIVPLKLYRSEPQKGLGQQTMKSTRLLKVSSGIRQVELAVDPVTLKVRPPWFYTTFFQTHLVNACSDWGLGNFEAISTLYYVLQTIYEHSRTSVVSVMSTSHCNGHMNARFPSSTCQPSFFLYCITLSPLLSINDTHAFVVSRMN